MRKRKAEEEAKEQYYQAAIDRQMQRRRERFINEWIECNRAFYEDNLFRLIEATLRQMSAACDV